MKYMIDPPLGWKYGFPKWVDTAEYHRLFNADQDEFTAWLTENGYPVEGAESAWKHCRYVGPYPDEH